MINLLPSEEKKILSQEENRKIILILGITVLFFLLSFNLILFLVKIQISAEVDSQKIQFDLTGKEFTKFQALEEKLNLINQNISKLSSFYQGQFNLIKFLERISQLKQEGIYFTSLSFLKNPNFSPSSKEQNYQAIINISGFSPTVEILAEFKKNLEKERDFKEIFFPSSSWLKLTEIDFNTTFKIIPDL